MTTIKTLSMGLFALALSAGAATAQQTQPRVGVSDDWSVFQWANPKACAIASAPTASKALRGGKTVTVSRGEIYFIVTDRPSENVSGEIAFSSGYPFRKDSTVEVKIKNDKFTLFTDGQWAWPEDAATDAKLIKAMKLGADAIVTGISERGTTTIDTFSLKGFTASLSDAQSRCK